MLEEREHLRVPTSRRGLCASTGDAMNAMIAAAAIPAAAMAVRSMCFSLARPARWAPVDCRREGHRRRLSFWASARSLGAEDKSDAHRSYGHRYERRRLSTFGAGTSLPSAYRRLPQKRWMRVHASSSALVAVA